MVLEVWTNRTFIREVNALVERLNFLDRSKDGLSTDKAIKECVLEILNMAQSWDFNNIVKPESIDNLDVFTAIWKCNDHEKISWIALLMCFFSIFPNLRSLLINSIPNWDLFLDELPENKETTEKMTSTSNKTERDYPGFYTVMESLSLILTTANNNFSFESMNLKEILLHSWLPIWRKYLDQINGKESNYKNKSRKYELTWLEYQQNNQLSQLWKDESSLQFIIAIFPSNQLDVNNKQVSMYNFFINKVYQRIVLINGNWIDTKIYQLAIKTILNIDFLDTNEKVKFNLSVIMEVIDHPEFNFVEESKLVLLLYYSLSNLTNVKSNSLHTILSKMGTTQTLLAMFNLTEFIIAKYVNNFQNNLDIVNGFIDNFPKYKVPTWFSNEMLPPIPPISKSLFIFDSEEKANNLSNLKVIETLLRCSFLINVLKHNLLTEYHDLYNNLNLIELDSNCDSKYLMKEQFFQLNYIPLFTVLLMSDHLQDSPLFQIDYLSPFLKNAISLQSTNTLQLLLKSYGNIALYHFLKFIDKISKQNLILQKISIRLLTTVFLYNKDRSIINICRKNELSLQILIEYIKKWNDGGPIYQFFYEEFIKEKQPNITTTRKTLRQLLQEIPDYKDLLVDYDESKRQLERKNSNSINIQFNINDVNDITNNNNSINLGNSSNNFNIYKENEPTSIMGTQHPQPLKNLKTYIPSKYDAYSSSVFIPSSNANNSNNNNGNVTTSSFTPQLQQAFSYQSSNFINGNNNNDNLHNNHNSMNTSNNNSNIPNNKINGNDYTNDYNNNYNTNNNRINTNHNNNISTMDSERSFSSNYSTNFGFTQSLSGPSPDFNHSTPNTPLTSNSNRNLLFSSHWNDQIVSSLNSMNSMNSSSPIVNSVNSANTVQGGSKIVNTGKNYILGGHNRVKNNSRQQSIHIDQFENNNN